MGVFVPLTFADFVSANASSTTALFPLCAIRPLSTFQISGPAKFVEIRNRNVESKKPHTQSRNEFAIVRNNHL